MLLLKKGRRSFAADMKILGIEHIGIAVSNDQDGSDFWNNLLKNISSESEWVENQGVNTVIFDTGKGKIELLEALFPDSPVAKFIDKKGPGIHHFCLEVDNILEAISELKAAGVELIYDQPRTGAEGYQVTFIHPKSAGGVLVELAEKGKS